MCQRAAVSNLKGVLYQLPTFEPVLIVLIL